MRLLFWIAFWVFLLDQASKYYVVHYLQLDRVGGIDVLPPFLNLRMAWNTGINFGLLSENTDIMRWVLIAVALVIIGAVLWWVKTDPGGKWQKIAAGMLVGGALGNVVDRLIYGAVADFINTSCCGISNPYSFNLADIAVFVGAIGLIFLTPGEKSA